VATGGGLGYAPIAPGTVGSLAGVGLFCFIQLASESQWLGFVVIAVLSLGGVWAASVACRLFGSEDPSVVVVDEIAGQYVSFWLVPILGTEIASFSAVKFIYFLTAGFVLFRLCDIFKPYPLRKLERLKAGWGIMADDLAAGIYTGLALHILYRIL
jgi:phosphatidylglycerophosphatase A